MHNQWLTEHAWIRARRPYYNIWPGLIRYLIRLREERVKVSDIRPPIPHLCFRFPEKCVEFCLRWQDQDYFLRCVLVSSDVEYEIQKGIPYDLHSAKNYRTLTLWMDFGEREASGVPVLLFRKLILDTVETIAEAMKFLPLDQVSLNKGLIVPPEIIDQATRLVLSVYLLSRDREDGLIIPDVLSVDKQKYDQSGDQKFVDKAHRRGKVGWDVGSSLEVAPHWRSASPLALYWTGKGRSIPYYRLRKGTIVHRARVQEVPTGFSGHLVAHPNGLIGLARTESGTETKIEIATLNTTSIRPEPTRETKANT